MTRVAQAAKISEFSIWVKWKRFSNSFKLFHFTHIENSEIFAAWATLAIPRNYQNIDFDDKVSEFLKRVGRRKFLTPIYRALINSGKKAFAQKIYSEARSGYHSVSQETLDDLLK